MGKRKIIAVVVLDMRDQMGYFLTSQRDAVIVGLQDNLIPIVAVRRLSIFLFREVNNEPTR